MTLAEALEKIKALDGGPDLVSTIAAGPRGVIPDNPSKSLLPVILLA